MIVIEKLGRDTVHVPIIGTSPLIMHRWSEKAKQMMLDAQQGKKKVKTIRDPQKDYEESMYRTNAGGYGFPSNGFKAATVGAARFYDKAVTMTNLKQILYVHGEQAANDASQITPIFGEPKAREDTVRLSQSSTDLRYRAEFLEWSAVLVFTYVTSSLSLDSLVSLIDAGGLGCGVGEWRPQQGGQHGMYQVDESKDIKVEK